MAKYKFTKTFKISEGICINADGTMTKLPESFVSLTNKPVEKKSNLKKCVANKSSYQKKQSVKNKYDRVENHYQQRSVLQSPRPTIQQGEKPRVQVVNHCRMPKVTISLDDPNNPHYQEGIRHKRISTALSSAPRIRGSFGGVQILKPINGLAAGAFKGDHV
jgi:hypothetical protein